MWQCFAESTATEREREREHEKLRFVAVLSAKHCHAPTTVGVVREKPSTLLIPSTTLIIYPLYPRITATSPAQFWETLLLECSGRSRMTRAVNKGIWQEVFFTP